MSFPRHFARLAPFSLVLAAAAAAHAQGTTPTGSPVSGAGAPSNPQAGAQIATGAVGVTTPDGGGGTPGIATETGTPGGLTSEGASAAAVKTSVSVAVDEARLKAAAAQVDAAWDAYWPKLSFTARYTRLSPLTPPALGLPAGTYIAVTGGPGVQGGQPIPPGTPLIAAGFDFSFPILVNNYLLQASLLVPLSDYVFRIYHSKESALQNLEAAKWNAKVTQANTAADARSAFYNVLRAHGGVVIARAAVSQSEAHLKDLKNQFAAKVVTVADVARVEATLANAELALIRSENLVVVTEANLRVLMHQSGDTPLAFGEDLTAELPKLSLDLKTLKATAFSKRAEIKAVDAQIASVEKTAKVVEAGLWPRLDAIGNATYANPNQRIFPQTQEWRATWDVSIQLTWSPNDALIANDNKKQAYANVAVLKATRDQIVDALTLDVTNAYTQVKAADASVVTTATELRAAEEAYRVRKEQFSLGATTSALLIDAEADLTRARLNHLNARVDARIARVQLKKALGEL